jgi:uncharacterized membrane protein YcjF (UPF0283 family)
MTKEKATVESFEERMARRRAEIAEFEKQLDREEAERNAEMATQKENKLLSALVLAGIALLAAGLIGAGVTLVRMAGFDYGDARRTGQANVKRCTEQGPVTNMGFGYWHRLVRVADVGEHRYSLEIAREDTPARPWLTWIGALVFLISVPPGLLAMAMLADFWPFRRK